LDGEVFAANGSITGGSLKSDKSIANIFSHERELNQLEPELIRLEKEKAEFSEEKKKYDNKLLLLREELDDSKSEIHQFELLITSKMEGVNQLFAEKEKLSQELKGLKQQHETDMNRLVKIEDDLSSVSKLEEFLAEKRKKASESGQEATQFVQDLREKSDLLRLQCNELRINLGKLESTLQFVCENLDRLTSRAGEIKEKLENSKQIKETNIYIIGKLEEEINLLINKNDFGDSEKSNQLAKKISEMEESKRVMAARIDEIDNQRETLSGKLQQLRDKKTHLDYQLQNVDNEIDNKEQRIFEEYNLDYSECLAFKQTDYDALRGSQEATKLKKGIQSLGDVNVGAIESYKEASEKYNEFLSSREDLVRAESDLVKIIKDLSSDMLKIFNENFEKTRVNFVKIFKELFDGGDADLLLIEDEDGDPLSRGIDIVAQPPQKKLQNISLLSGGERALTAIAILFAILKLRPMPFCVLDEIEAALDDANASRFAKYLRRFSEETQFIVITHRKPTMELADSLYGVTMEEKGVSKIVSVKLSDAVAQSVDSIGA
jgi:chromosome segregation protein